MLWVNPEDVNGQTSDSKFLLKQDTITCILQEGCGVLTGFADIAKRKQYSFTFPLGNILQWNVIFASVMSVASNAKNKFKLSLTL
jgi:hypothetical protein